PGPALGGDDVASMFQLGKEVRHVRVVVHLHPRTSHLMSRVRVRASRRDLVQLVRQANGRSVRSWFAPWVVGLEDVDAIGQLDDSFKAEMGAVAIEWMGDVGQAAHLVHEVQHALWPLKWRQGPCDEQTDDLTLERLHLFADDGERRR